MVEETRRLKLVISYDGTDFCGWQIQPNGPTIQQTLTEAIFKITGVWSPPVGAGRTDSGVHALGQVAHVTTPSRLSLESFARAVNAQLPEAIRILRVEEAGPDFHAVRDATRKHYRYIIQDGPVPDVFLRKYCWKVFVPLDVRRMAEGARHLVGTHDFRCFETEWPNRKSSVRTIFRCEPIRLGELIYLDVEADGFLYNMVRAIAGTLYEVGRGKWPAEMVQEILSRGKRIEAGPNAPARGLVLVRVEYSSQAPNRPS